MDEITREPMIIRAEDINPRYNWGRALPAFGTMGVDFEERVDYRRLHRYRFGRIKAALENSELGALLVFDVTVRRRGKLSNTSFKRVSVGDQRSVSTNAEVVDVIV